MEIIIPFRLFINADTFFPGKDMIFLYIFSPIKSRTDKRKPLSEHHYPEFKGTQDWKGCLMPLNPGTCYNRSVDQLHFGVHLKGTFWHCPSAMKEVGIKGLFYLLLCIELNSSVFIEVRTRVCGDSHSPSEGSDRLGRHMEGGSLA